MPSKSKRQPALLATSGPLAARLGAAFFASLPTGPGVYRFYGEDDRLLYIGQSGNLRARVGSYRFVNSASHSRRIVRMVARTWRAAWEPCGSVADAIALEARLLLEHAPPFNRAGVWQPPPWWVTLQVEERTLRAALTRAAPADSVGGIGPLPSAFRYTFASLMRCVWRWQWPATEWWNLPCGMARAIIPPEQSIPLRTDGSGAVETLRAFISHGCAEAREQLTGWVAELDPESPEGMFWTADADALQKYAAGAVARSAVPRTGGVMAFSFRRRQLAPRGESESAGRSPKATGAARCPSSGHRFAGGPAQARNSLRVVPVGR